jgi:curved DNA-binding protein CbpA
MNYYAILGIPEDADRETTRRAFRLLVRRYHPDAGVGSSPEEFRNIVDAYETLRDPVRRAAYDASLRAARRSVRKTPLDPIRVEPIAVEPLVEPLHMKFRVRQPRYAHGMFFADIFSGGAMEELFAEILEDAFGDFFFGRPF